MQTHTIEKKCHTQGHTQDAIDHLKTLKHKVHQRRGKRNTTAFLDMKFQHKEDDSLK